VIFPPLVFPALTIVMHCCKSYQIHESVLLSQLACPQDLSSLLNHVLESVLKKTFFLCQNKLVCVSMKSLVFVKEADLDGKHVIY